MKKKMGIVGLALILVLIGVFVYLMNTNLWKEPRYEFANRKELWLDGKKEDLDFLPFKSQEQWYLDYQSAKRLFGLDLVWDQKNHWLIYSEEESIYRIRILEGTIQRNRNKEEQFSGVALVSDVPYLSVSFLEEKTHSTFLYGEKTGYWRIDREKYFDGEYVATKRTKIRMEPNVWSSVVDVAEEGETVFTYREEKEGEDQWLYVMTKNNIRGFIAKSHVMQTKQYKFIETKPEEEKKQESKLNITWEAVYNVPAKYGEIEAIPSLDVIIPTWFELANEDGIYKEKADPGYVAWAKNRGYQVWGLFSNSFDPDMTKSILEDAKKRETTINQIIDYCLEFQLSGINIDYENVYEENKEELTQFMKELYPAAKEEELKVSIDVTVRGGSANWSRCFDRKALSKYVDYMMLMAYDEHWGSSPVAGSVASLPWTEEGIVGLLEEVPKEKLILGVPFYTRRWERYQEAGQEKVRSKAWSSQYTMEWIAERKLPISWDDKAGQHYAKYQEGEKTYEIWLEDETSLKARIDLIQQYDLAGIASWRRGFELPEFWNVIAENLN